MIRYVNGGAAAEEAYRGPCVAKKGYSTVANGRAQRVDAKAGEIAVPVRHGDAYTFTRWAVGPEEEVLASLPPEKETRIRAALAAMVAVLLLAVPVSAAAQTEEDFAYAAKSDLFADLLEDTANALFSSAMSGALSFEPERQEGTLRSMAGGLFLIYRQMENLDSDLDWVIVKKFAEALGRFAKSRRTSAIERGHPDQEALWFSVEAAAYALEAGASLMTSSLTVVQNRWSLSDNHRRVWRAYRKKALAGIKARRLRGR